MSGVHRSLKQRANQKFSVDAAVSVNSNGSTENRKRVRPGTRLFRFPAFPPVGQSVEALAKLTQAVPDRRGRGGAGHAAVLRRPRAKLVYRVLGERPPGEPARRGGKFFVLRYGRNPSGWRAEDIQLLILAGAWCPVARQIFGVRHHVALPAGISSGIDIRQLLVLPGVLVSGRSADIP